MLNKVGKVAVGSARVAGEAYKFSKLLVILGIVLGIAFIGWFLVDTVKSIGGIFTGPSILNPLASKPVPQNVAEQVSDERLKCLAYAMLADFEGSTNRRDADKVRIVRTVANYAKTFGVDECEIFHRQMELVVPDSGQRKKWLVQIFDRSLRYIERTFSDASRNAAFLLAKEVAEKPDASWTAVVMIRPDRSWSMGNQSSAETAAIRQKLQRVPIDKSDFEFYKLK